MSKGMSPKSTFPEEFNILDFSVEEENWNEYELSDGTILRARVILKRIVQDPMEPTKFAFDLIPPTFTVNTPIQNRGERNNEPITSEINNLPTFEVKILRSDERNNLYRILKSGQLIRMKLSVNKISRATGRFDKDGLPYYIVNSGPLITLDAPNLKSGQ